MPKAKVVKAPPRAKFDYDLDFKNLDLRANPHLYRIGLGEQGVLSVEPYKSEILPLWRFKTPDIARTSSESLRERFYAYKEAGDFIGMDMTRKFIQMGVTRARRYANWSGGRKYTGALDANGKKVKVERGPENEVKAESARIFGVVLKEVQADQEYQRMAELHREIYEHGKPVKEEEESLDEHESPKALANMYRNEHQTRARVKKEEEDA